MFVLNVYFCCELRFVATYAPNSDFYSEIQELTQILLRISEEKNGSWGLWPVRAWAISLASILILGLLCFWQCLSLFVSEDKHNFKDGDLPSSAGG